MGSHYGVCDGCGARIYWVTTDKGKAMPLEPGSAVPGDVRYRPEVGHTPHWARCPARAAFRKGITERVPAQPSGDQRQLALLAGGEPADEARPVPYMDAARIAIVRREMARLGLREPDFHAIRRFEGLGAPVADWDEALYDAILTLARRTAALRDAWGQGPDAYRELRAQLDFVPVHEEGRRPDGGAEEVA